MKAMTATLVLAMTMLPLLAMAKVVELNNDNVKDVIGADKPVFAEFFAPWCGHCKQLAPEWKKLEEAFEKIDDVIIAKMDADANKDGARNFDVSGFPTLKYFYPKGHAKATQFPKGKDYEGARTADALAKYVNEMAGTNVKIVGPHEYVTALGSADFHQKVGKENTAAFVEFYAPWCGHCKKIAPEYEKFAKSFVGEDSVLIAKVDATEHRELSEEFDISGYPSLRWFPAGEGKKPETYSGGRTAEDFVKFVNGKVGTKRTVGGGFEDGASLTDELKALIERWKSAKEDDEKNKIIDETKTASANVDAQFKKGARFYPLTMKKLLKKEDYVETEQARLRRLLESGQVATDKVVEFNLRLSILDSFK